jgi:ribosomal protein S4
MPEYWISRPNTLYRRLVNKKYRQFKTDLWGNLSRQIKVTTIVKVIANHTFKYIRNSWKSSRSRTKGTLSSFLKIYNAEAAKRYVISLERKFPYDIRPNAGTRPSGHAKNPPVGDGLGHIARRKFTLFYGANRLRIPTFQRFSKTYSVYRTIYAQQQSIDSIRIMESRIDIFLFRVGFFTSVYQARVLCYSGKATLLCKDVHLNPRTFLKPFEMCSVRHYRVVQKYLCLILENELISYLPKWANVSYTYMTAFLNEYPTNIGYPCKDLRWFSVDMFNHGF